MAAISVQCDGRTRPGIEWCAIGLNPAAARRSGLAINGLAPDGERRGQDCAEDNPRGEHTGIQKQ